jgi:hypothetical protein
VDIIRKGGKMEYKKDLEINKNALDNEWLSQPNLFFKYAKESAKADADAKRAKENLEVVDAELYLSIKRKADSTGDKTTEAGIKSQILNSDEHKKASDDLNNALEESKLLSLAVEAMNQRKYALENLVRLHLAGYYSSPSDIEGDGTTEKAVSKKTDKANQKLSDKYKKNK